MKKYIIFIALIITAIVAIYMATNKDKSTIKQELRDFTVQDTSAIDKIFLVDKASNSILLERLKGIQEKKKIIKLMWKVLLRPI